MKEQNTYIGQVLDGRYRVERLLGEGGMGAVYEGHHVIVGKRVAIKMLHAEFATNEEVLKRFYREAQAAAAIGHKNIIDIMDVGVTPLNEPYIVMEYLEGEDLESMLHRTGPLGVEAACGILEPALMALGAAHSKGIVHRDLKPANIFLVRNEAGPPTVKLIDFGISKFSGGAGGATKLTQTGSLLGTPAFMSPEQARGTGDIDHRTDIYAMGVILYQMLTGELPFKGENYNSLLISVLTEPPPPLRSINPEVPADAEALVLRALSKDPAQRSQSALEMLEAFAQLSAYKERDSGMSLLGTRLRSIIASGDLGGPKSGKGNASSASRVLSQMAKATPGAWAGTAAKSGPSKGLIIGLAGGGAALVAAVVVVLLVVMKDDAPAPVVPAAPVVIEKVVEGEAVTITVEGAPEGATIVYEGAPVPMNPFKAKKAGTVSPLRVEAPGFEPFAMSVVPEKDLVVRAEMKPVVEAPAVEEDDGKGAKTSRRGRGDKRPEGEVGTAEIKPEKKAETKAEKAAKKLAEGRRGAVISEDFE